VPAELWWRVVAERHLAPGVAGQGRDHPGDGQAVRRVRVGGVEDAPPRLPRAIVLRVTNPGDRFLPHPDAGWYDRGIGTTGGGLGFNGRPLSRTTPAERRSFARYLVGGNGGGYTWELRQLAEWDPAALAPWADHVLDFDDAALTGLFTVDRADHWRAGVGAGDEAERIDAAPPVPVHSFDRCGDPAHIRANLLVGVDSAHALGALGELGRRHRTVAGICATRGVWVPATGPAVRRYAPRPREIVRTGAAPEPGLRAFPPPEEVFVDPRGRGCALPLAAVLTVDIALLGVAETARWPQTAHHFIASFCEDCEADEEIRGDRGWRLVTRGPARGRIEFAEERDELCPGFGDGTPGGPPPVLALDPAGRFGGASLSAVFGHLGGRPHWAQYPVWPGCCDRPMFFVGYLDLGRFGGVDAHTYGFQCECGSGAQVVQTT
jgi:hypothetical protein